MTELYVQLLPLMKQYNIPIENVIRHYDVTGKLCPEPYIDETVWGEFKAKIRSINAEDITPAEAIAILHNKGIISEPDKWYSGTWTDDDFKWLLRKFAAYVKEE